MNKVKIGKVVTTRGIKGEIKILSYTNIDRLFEIINKVIIGDDTFDIEYVKYVNNCPVLKLKGIDVPETARELIGNFIFAQVESLPQLDPGEYYVKDILGSKVYNEDGNLIGTLTDVFFTGANDVYQITTPENKVLLIPAVKEFILDVNISAKTIKLHLIDGMLD